MSERNLPSNYPPSRINDPLVCSEDMTSQWQKYMNRESRSRRQENKLVVDLMSDYVNPHEEKFMSLASVASRDSHRAEELCYSPRKDLLDSSSGSSSGSRHRHHRQSRRHGAEPRAELDVDQHRHRHHHRSRRHAEPQAPARSLRAANMPSSSSTSRTRRHHHHRPSSETRRHRESNRIPTRRAVDADLADIDFDRVRIHDDKRERDSTRRAGVKKFECIVCHHRFLTTADATHVVCKNCRALAPSDRVECGKSNY